MTTSPQPDPAAAEPDRYAALLDEARRVKGVSLGRDAWRRLRKSYAAMASLWFLVLLLAAALLTPLLPLQSPVDIHLEDRVFLPPDIYSVQLGLTEPTAAYEARIRQLEEELQNAPADQRAKLAAQLDEFKVREDPIRNLWHQPGPVDRWMIRTRLAIFGDWALPSLMGTDKAGRDLMARLAWGARVSLTVGVLAALVSLVIGVTYGATAGYLGGLADDIMMRIVDVMYSIPFIFVVIFFITILRADSPDPSIPSLKERLDAIGIDQIAIFYILIGLIYWLTMSRVVRGQVISLKNDQFIEAARTIGASRARIVLRHLIPNVMSIVIVYLTLTIPAVMLFEAFLSFLGLGVEPPDVSWGTLANEGIQVITPVKIYWWLVLFPGLALALTLFALNFLGDGLRDALDPRMKNR